MSGRPAAYLGALLALIMTQAAATASCDKANFRIAVDAGHSAAVPGAISARGITEYAFNLRLSALIAQSLVAHGYRNVLRMVTAGPNLVQRALRANAFKADLFLSVHHDSAQPQYFQNWTYDGQERSYIDRFKGWSLFVSQDNAHFTESVGFATLLADRLLMRRLPFSTHHAEPIKGEGKSFVDAARGIYRYDGLVVLRMTDAPAVLMESGLIINRDEETALAGPERQNALAQSVAEAIDLYCASRK